MPTDETPAKRGRVIAAFPATGKSFIAGRDHRFADSDSSTFSWASPGVRHPEWPSNYVAHIKGLLADGSHVLCSTHREVRDALVAGDVPFALVYPADDQRAEYLRRMRDRGSDERLVEFIGDHWEELIASCGSQEGCRRIMLPSGGYLLDVLRSALNG